MMDINSNILRFSHKVHSPEWHNFRNAGTENYSGGIGASEIATVMGIAYKYDSAYALWERKVGLEPHKDIDNERMFNGREDELRITKQWCCYDPETKDYITRYKAYMNALDDMILLMENNPSTTYKTYQRSIKALGKQYFYRNGYKPDYYLVNPDYPWLFASLDFWCDKGYPVECKTISWDRTRAIERTIGKYERNVNGDYDIAGIVFLSDNIGNYRPPVEYEVQCQQQMLITETNYCELAMLIDEKFIVNKYSRNDEFCKELLKRSLDFHDTILEARDYLSQYNKLKINGDSSAAEIMDCITSLSPGGGKEEGYAEQASKYHQPHFTNIQPIDQDTIDLKSYVFLDQLSKSISGENGLLREIKNKLIERFLKGKGQLIEIEDIGKIEYKLFNKNSQYKDVYIKGKYGANNVNALQKILTFIKETSNNL